MIALKYYKSLILITIVSILSLFPENQTTKLSFFDIPYFDKIVHFIMYTSLSFILIFDIKKHTNKPKNVQITAVILILFIIGSTLEFFQESFITGRYASFFDIIANLAGSITGVFIFFKIYIKKSPL